MRERIADTSVFLAEQPTAITGQDEPFVRRMIEKITVFEDTFTDEFNPGVMMDVEA